MRSFPYWSRASYSFNPHHGYPLTRCSYERSASVNGLGLIETAEGHYQKADSLFARSLMLHEIIYKENHPFTAIVYLNYAALCIKQGKLSDAEEKLNKALSIDKQYFKSDHDVFGDVFAAFGDLSLEIYQKKFGNYHWKVVMMKKNVKTEYLPTGRSVRFVPARGSVSLRIQAPYCSPMLS
jgi:tetratricopeptide (TPR) repeat protein